MHILTYVDIMHVHFTCGVCSRSLYCGSDRSISQSGTTLNLWELLLGVFLPFSPDLSDGADQVSTYFVF